MQTAWQVAELRQKGLIGKEMSKKTLAGLLCISDQMLFPDVRSVRRQPDVEDEEQAEFSDLS